MAKLVMKGEEPVVIKEQATDDPMPMTEAADTVAVAAEPPTGDVIPE